MWMMLQHSVPDDFVIATGKSYSVRDFLDQAAAHLSLDWRKFVEIDPRYIRPTEVDHLLGDSSKARNPLKFEPKVNFEELVSMMVQHDLELAHQEKTLINAGHHIALRGVPNA
jgi:GDPmannose 4,6-dehydratase